MQRLTQSKLALVRKQVWEGQGKKCALSGLPIKLEDAVMDHDHATGECRGVLHRGVNSMLGKIENHRKLAGLTKDIDLARFLHGVLAYLNKDGLGFLYPTFRTEDEKRLRRNAKARKRRAAAKESA